MNKEQELPQEVASESIASSKEIVSQTKLQEAGAYFGHKKMMWNPKMKPYITATRKGVHIIDTVKTRRAIEFAYSIIKKFAEREATFIFVGTRKQAQASVRDNALRTNSFYVADRWLGGTLTNNRTIFNSVKRMFELERLAENNYADYTKKEGILFAKQLAKLQKNLIGIKNMRSRPQVMIVADPRHDEIAVREARKLGVKVIAIVDTNNDPSAVDIAIPANDDSIKSVTLIMTILADAIVAAKGGRQLFAFQPDEAITLPEELKIERAPRPDGRRFGGRPDSRFGDRGPRREYTPRPQGDRPQGGSTRTISASTIAAPAAKTAEHSTEHKPAEHKAEHKVEHKVEHKTEHKAEHKPAEHKVEHKADHKAAEHKAEHKPAHKEGTK